MPAIPNSFTPVLQLIQSARQAAFRAVNTTLIELYWLIGQYISQRVASEEWGKGVVTELARYIAHIEPGAKGFSDKNLWRIKQFYEAYTGTEILAAPGRQLEDASILSTVVREFTFVETALARLSWLHHRLTPHLYMPPLQLHQCYFQVNCFSKNQNKGSFISIILQPLI